jgi:hypothetical protein
MSQEVQHLISCLKFNRGIKVSCYSNNEMSITFVVGGFYRTWIFGYGRYFFNNDWNFTIS